MFEILANDTQSLPIEVVKGLYELRQRDKVSKALSVALNKEEKELLELVKGFKKDKDTGFDEAPLVARAEESTRKRKILSEMYEEQQKATQAIYEEIDKKVNSFDMKTKEIKHLFTIAPQGTKNKKNKKTKVVEELPVDDEMPIPTADPNEPVYCTCRRVSFGQMVGCENEECLIEWFHFGCVGLTEEPSKWYCPDCSAKGFTV
jgi:hypothetical protein